MYKIVARKQFLKQLKKCLQKKGNTQKAFEIVVSYLQETGTVPNEYYPHKLEGKYKGLWECHIKPDWLLVWRINKNEIEIELTHTGTHSDLF